MNAEPLDLLLDRLNRGDTEAVDEIVRDFEPYLRVLVRHALPIPLRAKFDSLDVVQSVWVQVLRGLRQRPWQITDRNALRALLVTVTRRRLVSRYRHESAAPDWEKPAGTDLEWVAARGQPRPSEVAEAEELWQRMLALSPPEHHELLRLKRQGLRLEEIAEHTGMHEGSVRRVLRQLARRLAVSECAASPGPGDQA